MTKKVDAWNSPDNPPPVGHGWVYYSDNVGVLLADGSIVTGFFSHHDQCWYDYGKYVKWIPSDMVKGWRYFQPVEEVKR